MVDIINGKRQAQKLPHPPKRVHFYFPARENQTWPEHQKPNGFLVNSIIQSESFYLAFASLTSNPAKTDHTIHSRHPTRHTASADALHTVSFSTFLKEGKLHINYGHLPYPDHKWWCMLAYHYLSTSFRK